MDKKLLLIYAERFTAGAVFQNGRCIKAAPIVKWMEGLTFLDIKNRAKSEWRLEWYIHPSER